MKTAEYQILYMPVLASDEDPPDGIYHIIGEMMEDGTSYYESSLFENGKWDETMYEIKYWLKKVIIPSRRVKEIQTRQWYNTMSPPYDRSINGLLMRIERLERINMELNEAIAILNKK